MLGRRAGPNAGLPGARNWGSGEAEGSSLAAAERLGEQGRRDEIERLESRWMLQDGVREAPAYRKKNRIRLCHDRVAARVGLGIRYGAQSHVISGARQFPGQRDSATANKAAAPDAALWLYLQRLHSTHHITIPASAPCTRDPCCCVLGFQVTERAQALHFLFKEYFDFHP